MADPFTALLVMGTATRVAQAGMAANAADEKLKSLDLMSEQNVLKHQQKTLANFETTQKLLDSQIADATTRGVGLGSSSLEAIQRHTANVGAKEQSNEDIEESLYQRSIKAEKSNVQTTLFAELFGDAAAAGADFAGAKAKMPTAA